MGDLSIGDALASWPDKSVWVGFPSSVYDFGLEAVQAYALDLLREFGKVFDKLDADTASDLARRFFTQERNRLSLQEATFKKIADQVSPVVAVQFIQLQRQFETELEMERMKLSPLAQ